MTMGNTSTKAVIRQILRFDNDFVDYDVYMYDDYDDYKPMRFSLFN